MRKLLSPPPTCIDIVWFIQLEMIVLGFEFSRSGKYLSIIYKIFSMLIRVVSRDRFRLVTQRWLVRVCFDHTIYAVYILSWCYFRFTTYSPLIPLVNYFWKIVKFRWSTQPLLLKNNNLSPASVFKPGGKFDEAEKARVIRGDTAPGVN